MAHYLSNSSYNAGFFLGEHSERAQGKMGGVPGTKSFHIIVY